VLRGRRLRADSDHHPKGLGFGPVGGAGAGLGVGCGFGLGGAGGAVLKNVVTCGKVEEAKLPIDVPFLGGS
jgi:hypothetical protein